MNFLLNGDRSGLMRVFSISVENTFFCIFRKIFSSLEVRCFVFLEFSV